MALRMSCLIHGALLLAAVRSAHYIGLSLLNAVPDAEITEGRDFVGAVADKMPLWDEDAISRYERVQIATVKADIAMARQTRGGKSLFWRTCRKLAQRLGCAGRLGTRS